MGRARQSPTVGCDEGTVAVPDVPGRNEHRLLALLAGYAVHGELGDVVTAVGVHFGELGEWDSRSDVPAQLSLLSPPPQTTLRVHHLHGLIAPTS